MNPIVEKIDERRKEWTKKADEFMNPFISKLNERRKDWFNRGTEMWTDLQERYSEFFERGQAALDRGQAAFDKFQPRFEEALEASQKWMNTFENNVLTRMSSILEWAYTATGEKSEAIQKTREFVEERLAEISKVEPEAAEEPETVEAAEEPEEAVEEEPDEETAEEVAEEAAPPFEDYDSLNVKDVTERLDGMSDDELEEVRAYEEATKGRKTVLDAIERLLSE